MSKHEVPGHLPPDNLSGDHDPHEPAWVHSHAHEPNLQTPPGDGDFVVTLPDGSRHTFSPVDLESLPYTSVADCLIVSTGHGASGPFTFGGVRLRDLLEFVLPTHAAQGPEISEDTVADRGEYRSGYRGEGRNAPLQPPGWQYIDLVSADGFGTRLTPADLASESERPILLAYTKDSVALTRAQGLVRLIVPSETDDALRQVKWLATITIE